MWVGKVISVCHLISLCLESIYRGLFIHHGPGITVIPSKRPMTLASCNNKGEGVGYEWGMHTGLTLQLIFFIFNFSSDTRKMISMEIKQFSASCPCFSISYHIDGHSTALVHYNLQCHSWLFLQPPPPVDAPWFDAKCISATRFLHRSLRLNGESRVPTMFWALAKEDITSNSYHLM